MKTKKSKKAKQPNGYPTRMTIPVSIDDPAMIRWIIDSKTNMRRSYQETLRASARTQMDRELAPKQIRA